MIHNIPKCDFIPPDSRNYRDGSRLMKIKLKAYESSLVITSSSKLITAVQPRYFITCRGKTSIAFISKKNRKVSKKNRKVKRKRPRMVKKKKLIYENVYGLMYLKGPIPLPTQHRRYCLLSSPHVNKTAREHYEIKLHTKLLYLRLFHKNVINVLSLVDILPGVQADIMYS